MKKVRAAAVYARISSDQDGTGLGVNRQVEDCRRLAEELGWPVAEEYVDNDISGYTGKKRPAYQRLLADLSDGARDAVIVYHVDRLTRRPIELEEFVSVVNRAGVSQVRFVSGPGVDVANGDGLMVLRIQAAMAANESDAKSRRVRRKMDEVAGAGRPHGGSNRPFGYDADKVTVRPGEAEVIKDLVARFVAGESLRSLAAWLDAEGVRTVKGQPWRTPTLATLLGSARIAGLREHRGEIVGKAVWEPIISELDRKRVLARMEQRRTTERRTPRRYLLSGLLRCGRCQGRLYSAARRETRRYVCSSGPDHGGCGRLTVVAGPVEELIADAVLYRLDTPQLTKRLSGQANKDRKNASIAEALEADRAQLEELAGLYGARQITLAEWKAARSPIELRIAEGQRLLARSTRTEALVGVIGNGEQLRVSWDDLNLSRQAAIVAALLDYAVIAPGTPGARSLDPDRVMPVWRF
ncbi:MAG: recombinase family protein [Acidimicrobiia bacterium]